MHLLLLLCFSQLVLILGPIEAFVYIPLSFFLHFILFDLIKFNYAIVYPFLCVSFFYRPPSLLHILRALFLHI